MEQERAIHSKNKFTTSSIIDVFQASMLPELNIYNQAQIEIDTPLLVTQTIHPKTHNEMGVALKLEGDLEGEIFCLIDTYDKEISKPEGQFFKALFIESMNILMGQTLTLIENDHNIHCLVSHPEFIDKTTEHSLTSTREATTMSVGYKFNSIHNEFDCRILFNIFK